ncbi:iron-containing alcohol dehydrogenase [Arthrobacter ginkgonis]
MQHLAGPMEETHTMMFSYQPPSLRTTFATGNAGGALQQTAGSLGLQRMMVITEHGDVHLARHLTAGLGSVVAGIHPVERQRFAADASATARGAAIGLGADSLVAVGSGEVIQLARLAAQAAGLPLVAVPTDYSGTEMVPVPAGEGMDGAAGPGALPKAVVYDAHLVGDLPREQVLHAGLRNLSQCIEAFWAPGANPVTTLLAEEGIRSIAAGLRDLRISSREKLLYGAHLAGTVRATAGTGLLHGVCTTLSSRFDLPLDQVHAVMLPHVLGFSTPAAPSAAERIAVALGMPDDAWPAALESGFAVASLNRLYEDIGAPHSFTQLGLGKWHAAEAIAAVAATRPASHPRRMDRRAASRILRDAFRPVKETLLSTADLSRRLEGIAS